MRVAPRVIAGSIIAVVIVAVALAVTIRHSGVPKADPSEWPTRRIVGVVTVIDGVVEVKQFGTLGWAEAKLGTALGVGDLVRTRDKARAQIRFVDGREMTVRPDTLIPIEAPTPD